MNYSDFERARAERAASAAAEARDAESGMDPREVARDKHSTFVRVVPG